MTSSIKMITALGTPLTPEEDLHVEGLEAHLQDQLDHGINGFLVAGTMGLMQLLKERTYRDLAALKASACQRRGVGWDAADPEASTTKTVTLSVRCR